MTDPRSLMTIEGADSTTLEGRWAYAKTVAAANDMIPKALWDKPSPTEPSRPSPAKIMLVMETGRMLGIHPIAALSGIHVIENKATVSPALMSALVRRAGHKLRVRTTGSVEAGTFTAIAELIRADDPDFTFSAEWTPHRAARAHLCTYEQGPDGRWTVVARSAPQPGGGGNKPLPWENYTESMCKARAIAEVCREGDEDDLLGARYIPEELGAAVDETGEPVHDEQLPPERDWERAIAELHDVAEAESLGAELAKSRDYSPALWGMFLARIGLLRSANEDVYEADGTPADTELADDTAAGVDDPDWTGPACPRCGAKHDLSVHDGADDDGAAS